eukprot:5928965-Prymnesium_polylepis.2
MCIRLPTALPSRKLIAHDQIDAWYVETSRRHIGGDEDPAAPVAEPNEDLVPIPLLQIAVQRERRRPARLKVRRDLPAL